MMMINKMCGPPEERMRAARFVPLSSSSLSCHRFSAPHFIAPLPPPEMVAAHNCLYVGNGQTNCVVKAEANHGTAIPERHQAWGTHRVCLCHPFTHLCLRLNHVSGILNEKMPFLAVPDLFAPMSLVFRRCFDDAPNCIMTAANYVWVLKFSFCLAI